MRLHLKVKRTEILLLWAVIVFAVSSAQAFDYKKGEFVAHEQLINYSISMAQSLNSSYSEESYTITVLKKDKETIVRIEPKPKTPPIFDDSGLELHFREVEGGYEYMGGYKGI